MTGTGADCFAISALTLLNDVFYTTGTDGNRRCRCAFDILSPRDFNRQAKRIGKANRASFELIKNNQKKNPLPAGLLLVDQ